MNTPLGQLDTTRSGLYEAPGYITEQSIQEEHLYAPRADQFRMLRPIRISTKSSEAKEAVKPSSSTAVPTAMYNAYPQESDAAMYYGMNSLLHRMHATRYGIPTETLPEAVAPSDPSQDFQAWQQQQQQQQQRQQHDQHGFQHMPFTANTAWHHVQKSSGSDSQALIDDEDNDMEGVDEGNGGRILFSAPEAQQAMDSQQQQFLRNEHAPQAQQQGHEEVFDRALRPNVYEDINAQLRAAFLARAELEKGH